MHYCSNKTIEVEQLVHVVEVLEHDTHGNLQPVHIYVRISGNRPTLAQSVKQVGDDELKK